MLRLVDARSEASSTIEYTPPIVVTLVRGKSHKLYQHLTEWKEPPGAEDLGYLRHSVVYPSLRPGLLLRQLGDAVVVHDPGSLDCHSLNRPAAEILALSDGTRSVAMIAREYMERFQVSVETAREDVLVILEDLLEKKVLVPRQQAAGGAKIPD